MTGSVEAKAVDLLTEVRRSRVRLDALPVDCRPDDLAAAYAIQAVHAERLAALQGGAPVGYKIGCTNVTAQAQLGIDEPFYGRLFPGAVHDSAARLRADDFFMRVIEAEFAFRMVDDLPAAAAPYDLDGVAAAVGAVVPAIEVVDSRYTDWTTAGAAALIADNGSHGALIHGPVTEAWRDIDLESAPVILSVAGEVVREGVGGNALGHPLHALAWLANTLCFSGGGLRAGDLVSTGTCIEVYFADPKDRIRADFGDLGSLEVEFF